MKIATGEEADDREDGSLLNPAAQLGTPERRTDIAKKAAAKRWSDK